MPHPLLAAAMATVVATAATLSIAAPAPPAPLDALQDIELVADETYVADAPASLAVTARAAHDWADRRPLPGVQIRAELRGDGQTPIPLGAAVTDERGRGPLAFRLPPIAPGSYTLRVVATSPLGDDTLDRRVDVVAADHVHLRTDRKIYRPGETLNWRVVVPGLVDAHPRATPVELSIRDPRGTQMWRGRVETGAHSMAHGDLPLGPDAPLGRWTLRAVAPGGQIERTIDVRQARRPAFFVELHPTDDGARITARHPSGEPVRGEVELTVGDAVVRGTLDDGGALTATLPPGPIAATVTDNADRRESARLMRAAPDETPAVVIIAPEAPPIGAPVDVYVVATTPEGLLGAAGALAVDGVEQEPVEHGPGVTRFSVTFAGAGAHTLRAALIDHAAEADLELTATETTDAPRFTLADPVIAAGEAIEIDGRAPPGGVVTATLLRHATPIATAPMQPAPDGHLRAAISPPPGAFGLATVRLTHVAFDPDTGELTAAHAAHSVYLRPDPLTVTLDHAPRHRPGAHAPITVTVTDRRGQPVEGAGLAAEVVDRRALALGDTGPDLAAALRGLDTDAAPVGVAFAELLDRADAQLARAATLAALPPDEAAPMVNDDAAPRWQAEDARLDDLLRPIAEGLVTWPGAIAAGDDWAITLDATLTHLEWTADRRLDPWRRPTTWAYLTRFAPEVTLAAIAPVVADERLHHVRALLEPDPKRDPALPPHLAVDPWGHPISIRRRSLPDREAIDLIAPGPDGQLDTADDIALRDVFGPKRLGRKLYGLAGRGFFGNGLGAGGSARCFGGVAHVAGGAPVRRRFDETALWTTGVPTDAAGRARLDVHLPDSLTGWRLRVEALSRAGAVGAADGSLETWLPYSVDAALPERLTVGDRYTAPLVLHNRADAAATFTLTAHVTGAATADLGTTTLTVPPGDVRAVPLPLRATAAGEATIRLDLALDGQSVDAVERTLPIEPPGRLVHRTVSATLDPGDPPLAFTVPAADATATLRVYRSATDTVLDGLDSLLAEPHGCFEQTTSTTYPNLMVLRLLDPANRDHAAHRRRARAYVAAGYQRLVGYEVDGGGFSWFGEAPANQVLTAYGLVEFVDMAAVYPIDPELVPRTTAWLVGKQRKDGGWDPDESWLHDWSAVQGAVSTTAWITHALAAVPDPDPATTAALTRARAFLRKHRDALTADPYLTALWALGEDDTQRAALTEILTNAVAVGDGSAHVPAGRTLFAGDGRAADVQTTALAARLFHRAGHDAGALRDWLWSARAPRGGWGSTQGTVLALHAALDAKTPAPTGPLTARLDGAALPPLDLDAPALPTLELPPLAPGDHTLALAPNAPLRVDLRTRWRTPGVPTAEAHGIEVTLTPAAPTVQRGQSLPLTLTLHNPGAQAIAMPTVQIPIPPGFTPDPDSLTALVGAPVARYETLGSRLDLYLTALAPNETLTLTWRLTADATCHVMHRGAHAYGYYDPDAHGFSAPFRVQATDGTLSRR